MGAPWYEVWADEGLMRPYLLLVLSNNDGPVVVFDPVKNEVVHEAPDYERVRIWLLEDEYTCVDGRMIRGD